jgi:formylglycine-generating enzyme
MRLIPGGTFLMGSDSHYPEERPAREVHVDAFHIDETPVTNAEFARFVEATGYQSFAERAPDPALYPGILPEMIKPGSLLFVPPSGPVDLNDFTHWWQFCFGADWRHPYGPDSGLDGLGDHPVVHVAYEDAQAYADWAGKALPTEAEWECAARGGLEGAEYAWGNELAPGGAPRANYWQGAFPWQNSLDDGYLRTSPVRTYPANGFGLYDMIGNVWEWTEDWYGAHVPETKRSGSCCIPANPRGGREEASFDPCQPEIAIGRKVLKGGSHLCAEDYCLRYRPAARYPQPIDTSTSHVGFRCVVRA